MDILKLQTNYVLNIDQVREHSVPVTQVFRMVVTWFCKWQELDMLNFRGMLLKSVFVKTGSEFVKIG
jgi:hypothetical protein